MEDNPFNSTELVKFQGAAKQAELPNMWAMTEVGLCNVLDVGQSTWADYKNKQGLSEVTTRVCEIIYQQKFEGVSVDLLNANIIARVGLSGKQESDVSVSVNVVVYSKSND